MNNYIELENQVAGAYIYTSNKHCFLMKGYRVIAEILENGDIYRINTYMGNPKANKKPSYNLYKDKDFSFINYW